MFIIFGRAANFRPQSVTDSIECLVCIGTTIHNALRLRTDPESPSKSPCYRRNHRQRSLHRLRSRTPRSYQTRVRRRHGLGLQLQVSKNSVNRGVAIDGYREGFREGFRDRPLWGLEGGNGEFVCCKACEFYSFGGSLRGRERKSQT